MSKADDRQTIRRNLFVSRSGLEQALLDAIRTAEGEVVRGASVETAVDAVLEETEDYLHGLRDSIARYLRGEEDVRP
ncbi:MAG TPA: hypothetical protein VKV02_14495 [Acidobacteriaceae bacterium]|nr:hypothetical protein [Acidobacteriaceae bacterium]